MEHLKKILGLLRNHYEKGVLVVAILVLAGAAWYLYSRSESEAVAIKNAQVRVITGAKIQGVKPVDLSAVNELLEKPPRTANLGTPHFLFNPLKWAIRPDGVVLKLATGSEVGPDAMQFLKIRPLNFTVSFDRVVTVESGTETNVSGYRIAFTNDAARPIEARLRPRNDIRLYQVGVTNLPYFTIEKVSGPSNAPTELTLRLHEGGQLLSLVPGTVNQRAIDFEAELYYPVKSRKFPPNRKGAVLRIEGEEYKIIDISLDSVLLSDTVNGKQYTITKRAVAPASGTP